MKRILLASLLLTLAALSAMAQAPDDDTHFMIGSTRIGAYVSASASMTRYEGHAAGFGTLKVAATMNDSWAVGLAFSGLYYDKKLTALVSDGTYHANAAYAALYLEKFFPLTERLTASASITSGTGEMKYEYDQEYRAQKVWYQETIDQTTFAVFEPGAALMWRVSDAWQLGVQASYRSTSPLRLIGTSEALLREFNYGLTVKWQFL